jgi:D-arginine dehydrogenase
MTAPVIDSDVIVLGAGMAGVSLAAELATKLAVQGSVVLLEIEDQPGRHATGRSAAMFFESYGNATVRALTRASRSHLAKPPAGFADMPLLTPRACLFIAGTARQHVLDTMQAAAPGQHSMHRLDTATAQAMVPILRSNAVAGALLDESGHDIDVAALLHGYWRVARQQGARLVTGAGAVDIVRQGGLWQVHSRAAGVYRAPVLVNATGAWADQVAVQAGARALGLQPMRRTAMTVAAPAGHDIRSWPLVIDTEESFYFKPDAGQLLLSPANEDPMPPCDVVAEELDVALAVDRFERATTVQVQRVNHRWAGLRSFVADRTPVVGFDARVEGFFWLAGQGGYGIQTAPAMARAAAALITGQALPADIQAQGVSAEALSPTRAGLDQPLRADS